MSRRKGNFLRHFTIGVPKEEAFDELEEMQTEKYVKAYEDAEGNAGFKKGLFTGLCIGIFVMFLTAFLLKDKGFIRTTTMPASKDYSKLEKRILNKVGTLEEYISNYFLDEIDDDKMADSVYKGVIDGLGDEYAAYYTEEEFKTIQEKNSGVYCGIGAYIDTDKETGLVKIIKPMSGSPIEKAGGKAGDLIYKVDGTDMSGKEISEVQVLIKGEKGTKVVLTLIRDKKTVEVTVTRDEIKEDTVASTMLPGKIGYIQVTGFEEVTQTQFKKAVDDLEKQDQKAMIIDLRNNGGGLLDSAVKMLDRLIGKGLVVYSKDKAGHKKEYYAEDSDSFDKPLVILVNGNSASASEVFSGAIQDENVGTLIGTKTFGKGIVQGIFSLDDGSALKMTTAKYYTPKGRNIHKKGLEPDIEVELKEGEETLSDGKTRVDNQLKRAYDYLEEKTGK